MKHGRRLALCAIFGATTCIIPDRDIGFASEFGNPGSVRILFRPPMMEEMNAICDAEPEVADPAFCSPARPTLRRPGVIATTRGEPFCICPSGQDNRAIPSFTLYVEDPDVELDQPKDTLYGVLLLDPVGQDRPTDVIAYRNYLEPCGVAVDVSNTQTEDRPRTVPSQAREDTPQRAFRLDDGSGSGKIDLCNDNNGAPLPEGLHNLQFMVTDRPYFRPPLVDVDGDPLEIDGKPVLGPQQCGVPDLAAGATYAVIDFVFECRQAGEETDPAGECDCAEG